MRTHHPLALISGIAMTIFVACGSSNSDQMSKNATPVASVTIQAKDVKFVPDTVTVPAGSVVELKLENLDETEHDFQVDGLDAEVSSGGSVKTGHAGGHGGSQTVAVHTTANEVGSIVFKANKKGTYNFYCTISGHKEAGMVGTLIVG